MKSDTITVGDGSLEELLQLVDNDQWLTTSRIILKTDEGDVELTGYRGKVRLSRLEDN